MEVLHATASGSGPRVVLLHGFTQTSASWNRISDDLADEYEVLAVDLPGHGRSGPATDLWSTADAVVEVGGPGSYVGYSLGGRIALHSALAHPNEVERLVLLSATAGIEDAAERGRRRMADEALAASILEHGVDRFLERWLALPLFAGLDATTKGLEERRRNSADGLAGSLRLAGTGTMDPTLWACLGDLTMPVLVVAGEVDTRFREIGERLAAEIGSNAQMVLIPHAGHSAHLESPDAFLSAVGPFLAAEPPARVDTPVR